MKKFLKRLFCIHKYNKLSTLTYSGGSIGIKKNAYGIRKQDVYIFMCPKCGKFKITIRE